MAKSRIKDGAAAPKRARRKKAATPATPAETSTNGHTNGFHAADNGTDNMVSFTELPEENAEYLWQDRCCRGELCLLSGESGAGKGLLTAAVVAAVSTGRPLPGGPPIAAGDVWYLASEDSLTKVVKQRLDAAGANADRVRTFHPDFTTGRSPNAILSALTIPSATSLRQRPALMVLDCVSDFLPLGAHPHNEVDVRPFLQSLAGLARLWDSVVWIVRHPRKDDRGSGMANVAGAAAWTQVPRHVLEVRKREGEEWDRLLICHKNSNGAPGRPVRMRIETHRRAARAVFGPESDQSADELREDEGTPSKRSALAYCMNVLRDLLDDEEQTAETVGKALLKAQVSAGTAERAVIRLGVVRFKQKGVINGPWLWKKPDGGWKV